MGPVGDFLDKDIQRFNRLIEQTLWPLGEFIYLDLRLCSDPSSSFLPPQYF